MTKQKTEPVKDRDLIMHYVGIADAHGIESLMPEDEAHLGKLALRAESNRHRHAVVYKATMPDSLCKSLARMAGQGEPEVALKLLKGHPEVKRLCVEKGRDMSWEMIPNPKLDPFWSPAEKEVKS